MSIAKPATGELPRTLGLIDSASIIIGIVIGAGIFLVPRLVAQALPSAPLIVGVWVMCGILCFFGGLAYAELGAMMPETGGHYVYLRECFGPLAGFLCGWTFTLVVMWAAMAWLAVSFSITLAYFVPLTPMTSKLISVLLIAVFSIVNYRGIRLSATVQKLLTVLKVAGLCIVVGSALIPGNGTAGIHLDAPAGRIFLGRARCRHGPHRVVLRRLADHQSCRRRDSRSRSEYSAEPWVGARGGHCHLLSGECRLSSRSAGRRNCQNRSHRSRRGGAHI